MLVSKLNIPIIFEITVKEFCDLSADYLL